MFDFLEYTYIQYALGIGLALGISAAFISPYLVFTQQALIADGLAHISFTGIIIGILVSSQPLYFAIPFSVAATILMKFLGEVKSINGDASIGVVSSSALAIGLIIISVSNGFNRSIEGMLVGSILTITKVDLIVAYIIAFLVILFVTIFYRQLLSLTFDNEYAVFSKVKTKLLSYSIAVLTTLFVVIGVSTIGTLLISALTIFPALIASQIGRSFKSTLLIGAVISSITVVLGIISSRFMGTPAGSTIVVVYLVILLVTIFINKIRKATFLRRQ
ncbi:MAG: metal ABC transporter permease [Bacilli bacterium]|nr:metal ABC transporter permease [Bacilli bacterium]